MSIPMSFKICQMCREALPHSAFGKHIGRKFNLANSCKSCRNRQMILSRHRIKQSDWDNILIAQQDKCAICKIPQSSLNIRLSIDHCHSTSAIRGLLCSHCNFGIGNFKDNVEHLKAAIEYLMEDKSKLNKGQKK